MPSVSAGPLSHQQCSAVQYVLCCGAAGAEVVGCEDGMMRSEK